MPGNLRVEGPVIDMPTCPAAGATGVGAGTLRLTYDGTNLLGSFNAGVPIIIGSGAGGNFAQGGNSFGVDAVLGTNDAFNLQLEINNVNVATFSAARLSFALNYFLSTAGTGTYETRTLAADAQPTSRLSNTLLQFGAGGAVAPDAELGRPVGITNRLDLGSADSLDTIAAGAFENRALTADVNPRMRLDATTLTFGPGGAGATDSPIVRLGVGSLATFAFTGTTITASTSCLSPIFGVAGGAFPAAGQVRVSDAVAFQVVRRTTSGSDRVILDAPFTAGASPFIFGPGANADWTAFLLDTNGTSPLRVRLGGTAVFSLEGSVAAPTNAQWRLAPGDSTGLNWQTMAGGMFWRIATTAPTANPVGGFFLYVDPASGILTARGTAGTVTPIAIP